MRRRTLLRYGVATGIVGLAGCGGNGEEEPTGEPGTTESPTAEDPASPTPTEPQDAAQVVEVAPEGSLTFAPDSFEMGAGDTATWRFQAGGHNVRPDEQPGDSEWTGTEGGDADTFGEGHTHSHTFDAPGEYEYYCGPHQNAGMTGSFTVE